MKTNKQRALLLRSLDDDLSASEQDALEALLASSEDARTSMQEFTALRTAIRTLPQASFKEGFSSRVVNAATKDQSTPGMARIYSIHSGKLLRMAAIILLLVSVSAVVWLQPRTYSAPLGQQINKVLPDGSSILLSGGASISYKPFWGRESRHVTLQGEAFFDVTKNNKPFVVETFNTEVQVLGTRFNVRAWPAQYTNYTSVVLEEGSVAVTSLYDPNESYVLEPAESIIVGADTTYPKQTLNMPVDTRLAWRTGGLTFDSELLGDVVADLGRRYNIRLTLAGDLAEKKITYLQPNHTPIDTVLSDISQTHALSYRKTANGFELFLP